MRAGEARRPVFGGKAPERWDWLDDETAAAVFGGADELVWGGVDEVVWGDTRQTKRMVWGPVR